MLTEQEKTDYQKIDCFFKCFVLYNMYCILYMYKMFKCKHFNIFKEQKKVFLYQYIQTKRTYSLKISVRTTLRKQPALKRFKGLFPPKATYISGYPSIAYHLLCNRRKDFLSPIETLISLGQRSNWFRRLGNSALRHQGRRGGEDVGREFTGMRMFRKTC